MTATANPPLTSPEVKVCDCPEPAIGIGCNDCIPCFRCRIPIQPAKVADHEAECEELCPCNFFPRLSSIDPDHCGNACHLCWACKRRGVNVQIGRSMLDKHLIRLHEISAEPIAQIDGQDWGRDTELPIAGD